MTKVQEGNFSRRNTSWANSWLLSRKKKWLMVSACHAGMLGDHRTPVGSARLLVEYNVTCYIIFYFYFIARSMLLVNSVPHLTLPIVAPPLSDVDGICCNRAGLVVACPLAHDREVGVGPTRPCLLDNLRLMHNMGETVVAIDNIP